MHVDKSSRSGVFDRTPEERRLKAEVLAQRLHVPISVLGVIFLLVVIAQAFTRDGTALAHAFEILAWLLWATFVTEFLVRMIITPSQTEFWRRNWWQTLFLLVPFLRFLRILWAVRVARAGRILASAVRSTRSAKGVLTGRVGWLAAVTIIVILAGSQLLYEFSDYSSYAAALHDAALTVISGQPLLAAGPFAAVLEIVLALYSVAVFAALAGSLGAYFVEQRREGSHVPSGAV